jgi:hypothetical protein
MFNVPVYLGVTWEDSSPLPRTKQMFSTNVFLFNRFQESAVDFQEIEEALMLIKVSISKEAHRAFKTVCAPEQNIYVYNSPVKLL